jgi:hypothetical protein
MADFLTRLVERVHRVAETVEPVLTPVMTGGPDTEDDAWIPAAGLESDPAVPSECMRPNPAQPPIPGIDASQDRSEIAGTVPPLPPSTAGGSEADPRGGRVLRGTSGSEVGPGRGPGAAQVPVQTKQALPRTEVSAVASQGRDGKEAVPDHPGSEDTGRGPGGLHELASRELKVPSDGPGATAGGERGSRIGVVLAQRAPQPDVLVSRHHARPVDQSRADRDSAASSEPPVVRVTIGHIDVRAATRPAPAAPRPKPAQRPRLSLEDYLSQRERGER